MLAGSCPKFKIILALLCAAFIYTGCGSNHSHDSAQVYLIPFLNESGEYSLQEIEISSLDNSGRAQGAAALVYYENNLDRTGAPEGKPLKLNLSRQGQVWVPKDTATSLSLAAYAHMERLMAMDERLGIKSDLKWPRKVSIQSEANDLVGTNGARFFGASETIVMAKYNDSGVPIAANGGVLAHEHFHAHFNERVFKKLDLVWPEIEGRLRGTKQSEDSEREQGRGKKKAHPSGHKKLTGKGIATQSNTFMTLVINEGLAEYWAYLYTGQEAFIKASFPLSWRSRRLDQPTAIKPLPRAVQFKGSDLENEAFQLSELCKTGIIDYYQCGYEHAWRLARLFFELTPLLPKVAVSDAQNREFAANLVIDSLTSLAQVYGEKADSENLPMGLLLSKFLLRSKKLPVGICRKLESYLSNRDFEESFATACAGSEL